MNIIWKKGASRVSFYSGIEGDSPCFTKRVFATELNDADAASVMQWLRKKLPFDDIGVMPSDGKYVRSLAMDVTWPRQEEKAASSHALFNDDDLVGCDTRIAV